MEAVLKINKEVDLDNFLEDALKIVILVKPTWNSNEIAYKVFDNGITNKMFGFYCGNNKSTMILIRVHGKGTDLFLDREEEIKHFELLHKHNCAPSLFCVFNNGICYDYIPGNTLSKDQVKEPSVFKSLIEELVRMHSIPYIGDAPPQPKLFPLLRRFLDLAFSNSTNQQYTKEKQLRDEVDKLEVCLKEIKSPVVFCHNDILIHNVIHNSQNYVKFIDYEYAGFNYQAFDIGNHFCEFAGVEDIDYSLYPDKDFQMKWLKWYLQAWHKHNNSDLNVNIDKEVEQLYVQVNKFALAAHLLWGIWALVQARFSEIDFDYEKYSELRFGEYYKRKDEFLSL